MQLLPSRNYFAYDNLYRARKNIGPGKMKKHLLVDQKTERGNMAADFIFPKPRDWALFEDIVCDVFSRKYNNYNFQRYGRSGQVQTGVDIAGPAEGRMLGIQCKHHPAGNIETSEIDDEITKSESFSPPLNEYVIATSADRDTKAHKHVLEISAQREREGKYPVVIKFWEDIYGWLSDYPDLLYKHFTKHFPVREMESLEIPGLEATTRVTSVWPTTTEEVKSNILCTVGGVKKVDRYNARLGITAFAETTFQGKVDLEVNLANIFSGNDSPDEIFAQANATIREVKSFFSDNFFSKELTVYLQARLSLAMLVGWNFRKVTGYELVVKSGEQVYATSGLPFVPTGLFDRPPILINPNSREIVLIINIFRDITKSAQRFVHDWEAQPQWIITTDLQGPVTNAAHALSISLDLSRKIKTLKDVWGAKKIHLFTVMPASLATLTIYQLNAICPIHMYFMDHTENTYKLAGVLSNNM